MKLKYYISFSEEVENPSDIDHYKLTRVKKEIEKELYKYLSYSGLQIAGDFKLEFDLEE